MSLWDQVVNSIMPQIAPIIGAALFVLVMGYVAKQNPDARPGAAISSIIVCIVAPMGMPMFQKYYSQFVVTLWNYTLGKIF